MVRPNSGLMTGQENDIKSWIRQGVNLGGTLFLATLWELWLCRNKCVFEGSITDHWKICLSAQALSKAITHAFITPVDGTRAPRWLGWSSPNKECMILNTDGSVVEDKAGFGGLLRTPDGGWVHGFCGNLDGAEVIEVELMAILQGLHICHRMGLNKVYCQTDSLTATKWILGGVAPMHRYANLVGLIRKLLSFHWTASISHVLRECNKCADFFARKGHMCFARIQYFMDPPLELLPLLHADSAGELSLRV
ncbi:Ribonuclease H domain [Sesbania bispinosa]|nr:Ribonuclease H domain [Sesbania bispinosa]